MFELKNGKFSELEKDVLEFWQKNSIFEKSLKQRKRAKKFVFYEGPPTANGRPGIHHVLTRVFKDLFCRYKTMAGFYVERKAGWDTHGLPVELEVEKELGIKSKPEIERYGIGKFNQKCKESVWKYKDEWEKLTIRIAFWLDLKHPYITYDNQYIESLWWIIKKIWQKGLLQKDYKVVPYCPRCGTALSSHEVAQGYKTVKENSIYVKFKVKNPTSYKLQATSYFLVWTTTPWTLPANVALAVHPKIKYVCVKQGEEYLILGKDRLNILRGEYSIIKEYNGKDLLCLEYEPLYKFTAPDPAPEQARYGARKKSHFIVAGEFVSAQEGTGIVHIAPAFGEDDMAAAKQNDLSVLVTVDEQGKFKSEVKPWAGRFVKDADPLITEELAGRSMLYKTEPYEHEYPFCWRCESPLLYYAKTVWFVRTTALKKELLQNNKKINWVPSHLKEGRFGGWLKEVKDWAFSRERYWGTPLPLWECDRCGNVDAIGSFEELVTKAVSSGNTYFIMRHGRAVSNHEQFLSCWPERQGKKVHLVKEGIRQVEHAAKKLKKEHIDLIFSSDLLRTKQTAEIIGKALDIPVAFDARLRETNVGVFNGRSIETYRAFYRDYLEKFTKRPPDGELYSEIKKRVMECLLEIDKSHRNKRILIVSHGDPLWVLAGAAQGLSNEEMVRRYDALFLKNGSYKKLELKRLPFNEQGEIDLHRPYVDGLAIPCRTCGGRMERVKEVVDAWFDSGAMPFAQAHYPFAWAQNKKLKIKNKKFGKLLYPANFICEAIDQTRGWFYTLLAVSTLLGKGSPYKNVISTGHVLDERGQKMSKSRGNVVDPWQIIEQYGSDALRWYFYTVNPAGEPKLFNAKEVAERLRKFIMIAWNSYQFFRLYETSPLNGKRASESPLTMTQAAAIAKQNVLDAWILSRLNETLSLARKGLERYDVLKAGRELETFVDDLSRWYLRRSRGRFQHPENQQEFERASRVLRFVLFEFSKIIAPFVPFLAEALYRNADGKQESVHLEDYPKENKKAINKKLNSQMETIRAVAALGLKARAAATVKVRQPLAKLKIKNQKSKINEELMTLLKDELNVKEIEMVKELPTEKNWLRVVSAEGIAITLDTHITAELKEEGLIRELIRNIQEMRRDAALRPQEKISVQYSCNPDLEQIISRHREHLKKAAGAKQFNAGAREKQVFAAEKSFDLESGPEDTKEIWIGIKKF